MATKFYLHATTSGLPSGTLPSDEQSTLTPDANDFEGSRTTNRLMNTSVGVSQANLTNTSTGDTNAHNYYITRFVSPLLYQTSISAKTWTVEYGVKESNALANFPRSSTGVMYVNCYIWKPSDGTKVGTILDGNSNADGEEATTSQTVINFTFAGAAVTGMIPGDAVIVYEVWAQVTQGNGTTRTQDFYYDGTTENSTSNEAAFLSTPEDLIFTPTDGTETIIAGGAATVSTANTTQYWSIVGKLDVSTTEADVKVVIRKAGTLSKLSVLLSANSVTGSTTFTLRKNATDTSVVATASATGNAVWEDLTNSVSVAAGDLINIKSIPGAATNTFTIAAITLNFKPDDGLSCQVLGASRTITYSSASTTKYIPISGDSTPDTTEAEAKARQRKAGSYKYLYVYVQSNSRTTNTTFKSRKNGADGNLSVTFGNGETGVKEDTTHSDTVAVGDDYNFAITTSTGTENLVYTMIAVEFFADDQSGEIVTGNLNSVTVSAAATRYIVPGGNTSNNGTEAQTKRKIRLTRMTLTDVYVYLVANSVTADSTLKLRKNGANGNISITLTASTTGIFSDTSHTDEIGSGDDIDFQVVAGATGTSLEISTIVMFYKLPRVTKQFRFPYNILGRISKTFRWPYNIIGRVSKTFRFPYNILQRISKTFRFPYNIRQRVSKVFRYPYNVVARTSKTFRFPYNIRQRISKTFRFPYNIVARVSKQFRFLYNIQQRISKQFRFPYNILQRISKQFRFPYNIVEGGLTRISKTFRFPYNIVQRTSKQFRFPYNIQQRISKQFRFPYNIQQRISKIFRYPYNIAGRTSKTFRFSYNIQQRISKTFNFKYNIQQRISKPFTFKYNILQRITKTFHWSYNIMQRTSKTFRFPYNIVARVSKQFTFLYNISVRVSKAFNFKYNVVQRTSKQFRFPYNITQRVSKTFRFPYNITVRITKAFNFKYNVVARVSKSFTFLYDIQSGLGRVSKSFTFKYNILGRTSKTFTFKYNITTRVSKTFSFTYNIRQRISKTFRFPYNITQRVTMSFTFVYNIRQRVSKVFRMPYNVVSRTSKQFRFVYNIQQRTSKPFRFPYNITTRVSKQFRFVYRIQARVSKPFNFSYNILGRVSKSFTFLYNIRALLQQSASFAETISIDFRQGFGEIFVAGRNSIEVLRRLLG